MRLLEQLKKHEGFREFPYTDTTGHLTIGYGWNLDAGIDEDMAFLILTRQVSKVQLACIREFEFYRDIANARRDVITNMCFNLGIEGFKKFKKTIEAIESRDYETAAEEMLDSRWAVQVGERATELAEQMKTGEYKE